MKIFDDLKPHMDDQGRLISWPSPRKGKGLQEMALEYLASRFEAGQRYTERQVNDLLNKLHTFGDAALLRRELIERGYLQRLKDGSAYWRTPGEPPDTEHKDMGSRGFG
ncbi:MAG: DUF2087 domain-containing protein [Anaerolineae bacterium]|nr:DUF2087 domain-containing protein [Anaerolineae bacterium]